MCRQEVLYLCDISYCFFLGNILLFVVQSILCQKLGTCFSLSSQLQPQEAGKCHSAVLLQEFNTDLLVVVYAVDKTAHTHTPSLPSSLSHPLQSVGQPLGEPDTPTDKVRYLADSHSRILYECMHSQHYSNW